MKKQKDFKKIGLVFICLVILTLVPTVSAQVDIWTDSMQYTGGNDFTISSDNDINLNASIIRIANESYFGNDVNISGNLNISNNIEPTTNVSYNLGSNLLHWNNIFAKTYYGDGSKLTGIAAGADGFAGSMGHPHDQELNTTSDVTFNSVSGDGSGLTGVPGDGYAGGMAHPHDQDLNTTSAVTFATVDTGQGANELYDMDQNVLTTSGVTFLSMAGIGADLTNLPNIFNQWLNTTDNATFDWLDVTNNVNVTGNVEPTVNTSSNLGSNLLHWLHIYADIYYANGGDSSQWNTAYGWGDHALSGYLTSTGNPFNQELNTTDNATFDWLDILNNVNISGDCFADNFYGTIHDNLFDQDLNTTSAVTFATVDTGQGANELYDMDQNVLTTSGVTFLSMAGIGADLTNLPNIFNQWLNTTDNATFDWIDVLNNANITGDVFAANFYGIIHDNLFDQDLNTTDAPTFATVDTGQGANELYDMDQNVLTSSEVEFENVTVDDTMIMSDGGITWNIYINATGVMVWEME